jgi:hypothetical protein
MLHLWVGRGEGTYFRDHTTWLRFYDPEGRLLLNSHEMAALAQQRAVTAEQRAAAEGARAATAEAELTRLRTELARPCGENR